MIPPSKPRGERIIGDDNSRFTLMDLDGNCLTFFPDLELSFLITAFDGEVTWIAVRVDGLVEFIGQHMRVDPIELIDWVDAVTEYPPWRWPKAAPTEETKP